MSLCRVESRSMCPSGAYQCAVKHLWDAAVGEVGGELLEARVVGSCCSLLPKLHSSMESMSRSRCDHVVAEEMKDREDGRIVEMEVDPESCPFRISKSFHATLR